MEATFLLTLLITFLASFIGYELISKIPQTLHTPLMSGSNAISGITLIAAILIYPEVGDSQILQIIVLIAIAFATLNIVGGFSVTGRILEMFKKNDRNNIIDLCCIIYICFEAIWKTINCTQSKFFCDSGHGSSCI